MVISISTEGLPVLGSRLSYLCRGRAVVPRDEGLVLGYAGTCRPYRRQDEARQPIPQHSDCSSRPKQPRPLPAFTHLGAGSVAVKGSVGSNRLVCIATSSPLAMASWATLQSAADGQAGRRAGGGGIEAGGQCHTFRGSALPACAALVRAVLCTEAKPHVRNSRSLPARTRVVEHGEPGDGHGAAVGLLLLAQDALHQLVGQAIQRVVVGHLRAAGEVGTSGGGKVRTGGQVGRKAATSGAHVG